MNRSDAARRILHFASVDEAVAGAERLAAAEREGRLGRVGNWTLGQALGHLATWANFAFDGYPPAVCPPAPIRLLLRMFRNRVLTKGMTPGMKVGRVPGGTVGVEVIGTDEGLARFRAAMDRLARTAPSAPNPVFGTLTHEQWIQLNLRHAELHLGFQVPREESRAG
jgi:hypothetical protein